MINNTTESKRSNEIIFIPETDNQISEITQIMPFIFLPCISTLSGKEDSGLFCTGFTLNLKKLKFEPDTVTMSWVKMWFHA